MVAAVLYIWAPGGSCLGKVSSAFHAFSLKSLASRTKPAESLPQAPVAEKPSAGEALTNPDDAAASDPGPIPTGEIDPNKIQIIETKAIPKAGAQLPPKDAAGNPDNIVSAHNIRWHAHSPCAHSTAGRSARTRSTIVRRAANANPGACSCSTAGARTANSAHTK